MKITCEHCGTGIDTEKDRNCPHCGAPYSKNKEYGEEKDYKKKNKDYDLREREADIHNKELQNKVIEKSIDGVKRVSAVSVLSTIVFIGILGVVIFMGIRGYNKTKQERITNEENEYVTVSFNENAVTNSFEIKCDAIESYEVNEFFNESEDSDNYAFHIVFKNKTEKFKDLTSIYLTYTDDNGNEDVIAHRQNLVLSSNTLVSMVTEIATYTGNVVFEIPNYVTDVKIKFGKATIEIDNFRDKIK